VRTGYTLLADVGNTYVRRSLRKSSSGVRRQQKEGRQVRQSELGRHAVVTALMQENLDGSSHVVKNANCGSKGSEEKLRADMCNKSCYAMRQKATKQHVQQSFAEKIIALEKVIRPKQRRHEQYDPLYDKLKSYHDHIVKSLTTTTTETLKFTWSKEEENRLNDMNQTCKFLQARHDWTWGAADDSEQGRYNDARMQLCVTEECKWRLIECPACDSTGLLVGDQTESTVCYDCLQLKRLPEKDRKT